MTHTIRLLSFVFIAAELVACARTTVSVPRMRPAEVNLAGYRRIGVGTIYGPEGKTLRSELTTALARTGRFEVLERQKLDAIIQEQNLGATGRFDDETVASIGHLMGTAALVIGDVTAADYSEDLQSRDATCSRAQEGKSVDYPCIEFIRTANARLSVNLKVVDTESGVVLAAKTVGGERSQRRSTKETEPLPFNAEAQWITACRKEAVDEFLKVIAPYTVNVRVTLRDDSELPDLERGNNFAKIGNWSEARRAYNAAREMARTHPDLNNEMRAKVLYNLGIATGYAGDYDEGLRLLGQSYSLDPDSGTEAQIRMLKQFKDDDARLEQQRRDAVEGDS